MVEEQEEAVWLSLNEAASLLGVSTDTVRRRMKRGEFQSRQIPTPHGPAYQVRLEAPARQAATPAATVAATVEIEPKQEGQEAAGSPALVEMVRLMEKLQEENIRLQLKAESAAMWQGRAEVLMLQLGQAQETIKMLEAPKEELVEEIKPEVANEDEAKPWWKFW